MSTPTTPLLCGLRVAGSADPWVAAGFDCGPEGFSAGQMAIEIDRTATTAQLLTQRANVTLDGVGRPVSTSWSAAELPSRHPNGVCAVDHVVVFAPDFDRTVGALADEGLEPRRTQEATLKGEQVRQAFFLAGPCLLELVGRPASQAVGDGQAALWGVTFMSGQLDSLLALEGNPVASIEDAVQPGRRIAVARRELSLPLPVAFMDPRNTDTGR